MNDCENLRSDDESTAGVLLEGTRDKGLPDSPMDCCDSEVDIPDPLFWKTERIGKMKALEDMVEEGDRGPTGDVTGLFPLSEFGVTLSLGLPMLAGTPPG